MEIRFNTLRSVCKHNEFSWSEYVDKERTKTKTHHHCEHEKNDSGRCLKENCPLKKR